MWLRKKKEEEEQQKKLKNLIRFCSANKIDNYKKGGGSKRKKSKRIFRTRKKIKT